MDMIIVSMTSVIKNVNDNDKMTKKTHQIYHRYDTSISELPVNMDTMSTVGTRAGIQPQYTDSVVHTRRQNGAIRRMRPQKPRSRVQTCVAR